MYEYILKKISVEMILPTKKSWKVCNLKIKYLLVKTRAVLCYYNRCMNRQLLLWIVVVYNGLHEFQLVHWSKCHEKLAISRTYTHIHIAGSLFLWIVWNTLYTRYTNYTSKLLIPTQNTNAVLISPHAHETR